MPKTKIDHISMEKENIEQVSVMKLGLSCQTRSLKADLAVLLFLLNRCYFHKQLSLYCFFDLLVQTSSEAFPKDVNPMLISPCYLTESNL